jgi:CelD/BcsL family acetyltransferase involved in cellulose biosynthesis
MPATFEQYLQQNFKAKTRYNLRRQVRRLREHGRGALELVRIENGAQVPEFLDAAVPLTAADHERYRGRFFRLQNDAVEQEKLYAAAGNGILRSYLLRCGGQVVAYVKGFQQYETFYYHQIGFDERLAPYSPGIVMMYLMLEDLFVHGAPRRVNLYWGDSAYKQQFGNQRERMGRLVLLRNTLANRALVGSHATLRYFLSKAKNALGAKAADKAD